jgi:membrane-bound ClpP family serine protease
MRTRPRIYRPSWVLLLAAPGIVLLIADGLVILTVAMAGAVVLYLGVLWLLARHSTRARQLLSPDIETFDRRSARAQAFADRLGRIPAFGVVWRWAQRLTAPTVERMQADYRTSVEGDDPRPRKSSHDC